VVFKTQEWKLEDTMLKELLPPTFKVQSIIKGPTIKKEMLSLLSEIPSLIKMFKSKVPNLLELSALSETYKKA
jgi:hypothetical protein